MQNAITGDTASDTTWDARPSQAVLADRIAATVVHHEPGWRLPRPSALARQLQVSITAVDAAITELTHRHVLRRLPDGQVYRASPAEYLISLPDLAGFGALIDPMGTEMALEHSRQALRRPPADVAHALGLEPGEPTRFTQCLWAANGERAAVTTTYFVARCDYAPVLMDAALSCGPFSGIGAGMTTRPAAFALQADLPPASIGRKLRLRPGETVFVLTVLLADHPSGMKVALTEAVLRPGFFRLVVQSGQSPAGLGCLPGLARAGRTTSTDRGPAQEG